jgi:hypothetical protein
VTRGPEPLAENWRSASAYLEKDLDSGFVHTLWESPDADGLIASKPKQLESAAQRLHA